MDIPLVLEVLRPGVYWGPMAQTGVAYADFAAAWPASGSGTVPTEAEMNAAWATIGSAAAYQLTQDRSRASALMDAEDGRLWRAVALALIDELNILRTRDRDRAADVAAATSLNDLKTRWAARSALNDRTAAQARTAVKDKAGSSAGDS